MKQTKKRRTGLMAAAVFWLAVWQAAAMAIGQEVFLVSPIQAAGTLMELLPQADFWQRVGFSAGHILLGFALGVVVSVLLAAAAERWAWVDTLLAPVIQLVKATPVASFIILALVWVSGRSLSILISFLMVLPVLYSAVRTGIESADVQLLEMAQVFHLPLARRVKAIWLPAILPAFRQGCSVALGICWKSGVAAEVIGLPDGSIAEPAVLWAPSGWGKTTLLRILMGLEAPDSGTVQGVGRVGAVFQEDRLCPQLTAVQNAELVLPEGKTQYKTQIVSDFQRFGYDKQALALPARKLSGGQKRRAALLRALWAGCDTLLLDEPFTGMDPETMKKAAALLKERRGERAVLLATHDREAIRELGWRVIDLT